MAEAKTKETDVDVSAFIASVPHPGKRADAQTLCKLFEEVTGKPPRMWGPTIIGFGKYRYQYASGHKGETALLAFSPRKDKLVLYMTWDAATQAPLLARLGKHKVSVACLYINRLADVDMEVLRELVTSSYEVACAMYPDHD